MKKILGGIAFAIAAVCMTSSTAMATTTCPSGPYSDYNPGASSITCTTNNISFSNFQFSSASGGGAVLPTAGSIGVTPIDQAGNEGFSFNPIFIEGSGESQDATISFLVSAAPGTTISDLFIGFNGNASGTGATNFTETYCTTGFLTGSCGVFSVTDGNINQHIDISPTTKLYITKDFGATAGTSGSASISTVVNQYSNTSTVPEPATLSMMGLGLLGFGVIGRRRKA